MTTFTKRASELWRDYVTEGVPATGAHLPIKADIRNWGLEAETAIEGLVGLNTVWTPNVQGTGRSGIDDDGGIFVWEEITAAGSAYGAAGRFDTTYSYTGGTPGVVNSGLHALTTVGAGVTDFVWGAFSLIENNATGGGENAAIYALAHKNSTGSTWAGVAEAEDTTEQADPTLSLYAWEFDVSANGSDANHTRFGSQLVLWRYNPAGADVVCTYGHWVGPSAADEGHAKFTHGLYFSGAGAFGYGINMANADYSNGAILLGDDHGIIPDTAGNVLWAYSSVDGRTLLRHNTATGNAATPILQLEHVANGTFAAGMGVAVTFAAETADGNTEIGCEMAVVAADVTTGSEDFDWRLLLMSAGAARTEVLRVKSGTKMLDWSGGLATGPALKPNGTSLEARLGDDSGYAPFKASNVLSGTYTPTIVGVTNCDAVTAFECQYLRVGDAVTVSGIMQVDPTASGGAATAFTIALPVASDFTNSIHCAGTIAAGVLTEAGVITGDVAGNVARVDFLAQSTGNHSMAFTFSYRIV